MRKIYISAFILFMVCAFMSTGFFHPDEHFQLLEFANYKMGNIGADDLPWEFHKQMRPGFQVGIIYVVCSAMKAIGIFDPFTAALLLRVFTAALSFIALYLFFNKYKAELVNKPAVRWFGLLTFFLWYVPFISVRFSSESYATIFLLFALYFYPVSGYKKGNYSNHFLVGLMMGLSFICRYQMGFMVLGLGLWIIFIKKENIKAIALISSGFLLSFGIGFLCDYWLYDKWVFSIYNYFYQNLVENKAAQFGTSPFWFYGVFGSISIFPLFGIILVPCIVAFFIKYPRHIFTWLLVPFLLIHHIIGHKEMRFMFPVAPFVPFIIIMMVQKFMQLKKLRFIKYPFLGFWMINIFFLIIVSCKPAYDNMGVFNYVYFNAGDKPVYYINQEPPFILDKPKENRPIRKGIDLSMYFYQKKGFDPHGVNDIAELDSMLSIQHQTSLIVVRTTRYQEDYKDIFDKKGIQNKVVYHTFHSWFSFLNYNNWMSREDVGVWTIVEVKK